MPPNPISTTVRTACAGRDRRSRRGTDSSSRRRICEKACLGRLENRYCSLTGDRGEILQEIFKRRTPFEVVEEVLDEYACALEAKGATHDLRISTDVSCIHSHPQCVQFNPRLDQWASPTDVNYSGKFLMRVPKRLHAELAHAAKAQGVSLNQYLLYMLTRGHGERTRRAA